MDLYWTILIIDFGALAMAHGETYNSIIITQFKQFKRIWVNNKKGMSSNWQHNHNSEHKLDVCIFMDHIRNSHGNYSSKMDVRPFRKMSMSMMVLKVMFWVVIIQVQHVTTSITESILWKNIRDQVSRIFKQFMTVTFCPLRAYNGIYIPIYINAHLRLDIDTLGTDDCYFTVNYRQRVCL